MTLPEWTEFVPGAENQRDFRTALGRFTTGVTVVTTQTAKGPIGMTANSFSSVSMEPPLIMWCPGKNSARFEAFCAAEHFAIHVLGREHHDIAMGFAKSATAFDGLDMVSSDHGTPLLRECIVRFECRRFAVHDAGDHAIVVGQVTKTASREGDGLAFGAGRFGAFLPEL